jgi:hypothetical protein
MQKNYEKPSNGNSIEITCNTLCQPGNDSGKIFGTRHFSYIFRLCQFAEQFNLSGVAENTPDSQTSKIPHTSNSSFFSTA